MCESREKRFTLRLYGDNPLDAELEAKLERLVADGAYRSRNEVFRKGIELVYESSYPSASIEDRDTGGVSLAERGLREAAGIIAEEVVRLVGNRIGGTGGEGCGGNPEETGALTDEMASFLSGLNVE